MSDGQNAYEEYQLLAGHPPAGPSLKAMIARRIKTAAYQRAPDDPADVKGTKLWLLHPTTQAWRSRAMKMLKRDPLVRKAFMSETMKV